MKSFLEYRYKAVRSRQTSSPKTVLLFNAPADEILHWAGVPQKKRFDEGGESLGFQREENPSRVQNLGEFCLNAENIIQNPLLCATRTTSTGSVSFEPSAGQSGMSQLGELIIKVPDYQQFTLREVFAQVRIYIEQRVPELENKQLDSDFFLQLQERAGLPPSDSVESETSHYDPSVNEESSDSDMDSTDEAINDSELGGALFEESHILEFWQDVTARHMILEQIDDDESRQSFLGYSREALESYLKPVVLVDGQHRLQGAMCALDSRMNDEHIHNEIEECIDAGESPEFVHNKISKREVRSLPLSLLLSPDPAEQVFQFVVVNQKATPIGRALLGTIVSTTLSNSEMEPVANRLTAAGIKLEESRAITFLVRHKDSPFYNLVERGLAGGETSDLLKWSVLASLVDIFRNLRGGKLFHVQVDYAALWKDKYLASSEIIPENRRDESYECWRDFDGPWRAVFIRFFAKIRNEFGHKKDRDAHNYWGRPRVSNLFNKISLTIMTADFFRYLAAARREIGSVEQVDGLVDDWLEDVDRNYFNRDWKLSGVKKDSTGIRSQWSQLWANYRDYPKRLPQSQMYRRPATT